MDGAADDLYRGVTAHDKSIALLKSWLSLEQLEQFERCGEFDVIGSDTKTRYRINQDHAFNIHEMKNGSRTGVRFCVVPTGGLPVGDQMLAQKIGLETDEMETLRIANSKPGF